MSKPGLRPTRRSRTKTGTGTRTSEVYQLKILMGRPRAGKRSLRTINFKNHQSPDTISDMCGLGQAIFWTMHTELDKSMTSDTSSGTFSLYFKSKDQNIAMLTQRHFSSHQIARPICPNPCLNFIGLRSHEFVQVLVLSRKNRMPDF